jgi:galactose mutarotase-like enzyme
MINRSVLTAALVFGLAGPALAQVRYTVSEELAGGAGSPRVLVLRDSAGGVEAAVAPSEGGELSSLRIRIRGEWTELIYRARDYGPEPGFRGKSSFLWPAVGGQYPMGTSPAGSCVDGTYLVGERSYPMPCHGFAKALAWQEAGHGADASGARVSLELRDSPETRAYYPFGFRVRATYELAGGRLTVTYRISSSQANTGQMPFSIGNHVCFRVPFLAGTDPAEMRLETPNSFEVVRDSRGLITAERRARSFAAGARLGDFDASVALALIGYTRTPYAVLADPRGLALRITQSAPRPLPEPLVRFNIYGGAKQGYLCPEPWFGLQNSLNTGRGSVTVAPGADWEWSFELRPELQ